MSPAFHPAARARRTAPTALAALVTLAALAAAFTLALLAPPALAQPHEAALPPRLVGHTLQGEPIDLAALRGRVVLVYLWSTDCPVCLRELPELRRNLQGWKGRRFTVVAVNVDRQWQPLHDYAALLDRLAPPSSQLLLAWRGAPGHHDDFGDVPATTPTSLVIDRTGAVVARTQGAWSPELWDRMADLVVE